MSKTVSKSPERHSFQKEGYVKRQAEKGEPVNEEYLDYFQKIIEDHDSKFDDPETHKNNMEYDLLTTDWILEKVRASESYAQNLYAAMCNNGFIKLEVIPVLKGEEWSCSWRYAGGIIADMRQKGDYIDWYCSGIRNDGYQDDLDTVSPEQYVSEGLITDEIRNDLQRLGWAVAPGGDWEDF
jgi:hypothetical protein